MTVPGTSAQIAACPDARGPENDAPTAERRPTRLAAARVWAIQAVAVVVVLMVLVPVVAIGTSRPTRTFDLDRIGARLAALDSLRSLGADTPRSTSTGHHRRPLACRRPPVLRARR